MKPQAQIVEAAELDYRIQVERNGTTETVSLHFKQYQDALDYILEQGWQLKREAPSSSLHVETRFLKP
jgi:hypothetical protein